MTIEKCYACKENPMVYRVAVAPWPLNKKWYLTPLPCCEDCGIMRYEKDAKLNFWEQVEQNDKDIDGTIFDEKKWTHEKN